uniref:Alkyl hydroperoxide reductase/thiol specific antioxidant/Mal allergen n=1 Tax=Acetithermum autotrophicum TaxID=1446466 RepID=H5STY8_ACEAU|nr:alkyl hydroperoxide reductase/thiol specific antioxidant/Mal allergen [Candidatus Acetothermum autotrophicum]
MLARLVVAVLIAVGAIALGFISYEFFASRSDLNKFTLTEGRGIFVEDPKELKNETAPTLGYLAPDFTLQDLNGQSVSLSSFRGKPVLLNFWATWCPPCRKEMPELQEFHRRYGDQVVLLGVNWGEGASTVKRFLDQLGVSYPNLIDERGTAFVLYRLTGIPESFFIDPEGYLRGVWIGPLTAEEIVKGFTRLGLLKESE